MSDSNKTLTWVGLAAVGLLLVILQIKLAWTRQKLIKAESKAKILELDIEAEKQNAVLEKNTQKAQAIKKRIETREAKLNDVYEKIGLLDSDATATSKSVDDAKERLRRRKS